MLQYKHILKLLNIPINVQIILPISGSIASQLKYKHNVSGYKNSLKNVIHSSTQNENHIGKNSQCTDMVLLGLSSSPPQLALHHGREHGSQNLQLSLSTVICYVFSVLVLSPSSAHYLCRLHDGVFWFLSAKSATTLTVILVNDCE